MPRARLTLWTHGRFNVRCNTRIGATTTQEQHGAVTWLAGVWTSIGIIDASVSFLSISTLSQYQNCQHVVSMSARGARPSLVDSCHSSRRAWQTLCWPPQLTAKKRRIRVQELG